jgi:hypothetical protein
VKEMPARLTQQSNFTVHFELDDNYVHKPKDLDYPYYIVKDNRNTELKAKLYLRNEIKDTKVTLVALQGDKQINLGVTDKESWHPALVLPLPNHSNLEVEVKLQWDANGSEELIVFPIIDKLGSYYYGVNAGVIRLFVGKNQEYRFSNDALAEHSINTEGKIKHAPVLNWLNQNNLPISTYMSDERTYSSESYRKIEIGEISYQTQMDILYLNERGHVQRLISDMTLLPYQKEVVELPSDNMEAFIKDKEHRQFLVLLNHRGDKMLRDYVAVKQKFKPVSTNFQQVIEIYPY